MGRYSTSKRPETHHALNRGFTLIELLTVIGILGILASGLLVVINPVGQLQKARDAQRKSDLGQIQKALETYYQDNNGYPSYTGNVSGLSSAIPPLSSSYIQSIPTDKTAGRIYYYVSTGQSYQLYTALENTSDTQVCGKGTSCPNLPAGNVCTAACNYGVSSTNTTP